MSDEKKRPLQAMEGHFREIITLLGEDVNREGLRARRSGLPGRFIS